MLKRVCVIWIWLALLPAFGQSSSKYELATITDTRPHLPAKENASDVIYDVTLRVGGTTYVILYTDRSGTSTARYAEGRSLLVLVGKKTITYNDILGRSIELPILSQIPAADSKQSKPEGK